MGNAQDKYEKFLKKYNTEKWAREAAEEKRKKEEAEAGFAPGGGTVMERYERLLKKYNTEKSIRERKAREERDKAAKKAKESSSAAANQQSTSQQTGQQLVLLDSRQPIPAVPQPGVGPPRQSTSGASGSSTPSRASGHPHTELLRAARDEIVNLQRRVDEYQERLEVGGSQKRQLSEKPVGRLPGNGHKSQI